MDDERLLAGLASGEPQASTAFVRRHWPQVHGLASAMVGSAADDVVQETFVRAWRFASRYDASRGTVRSWLLTIARNAAYDLLDRRREHLVAPEALALLSGTAVAGPAAQVADRERVRAALKRLPPEQAKAVVLQACYGLTAREIAERERIALGTAKTRIRLGLDRLRAEVPR